MTKGKELYFFSLNPAKISNERPYPEKIEKSVNSLRKCGPYGKVKTNKQTKTCFVWRRH